MCGAWRRQGRSERTRPMGACGSALWSRAAWLAEQPVGGSGRISRESLTDRAFPIRGMKPTLIWCRDCGEILPSADRNSPGNDLNDSTACNASDALTPSVTARALPTTPRGRRDPNPIIATTRDVFRDASSVARHGLRRAMESETMSRKELLELAAVGCRTGAVQTGFERRGL